ncbi:hypothetical protein BD410DRAFT_453839 [Rickenella mellea]|uniref:Uncharacterized protein n=1 Tax=Rickenella mellea TaxID=50990 RepID=A0A4Y7PVE7_9AGAM|nr:hypothetical protein BD410DRAFT_453839 [Rickenella mellea]
MQVSGYSTSRKLPPKRKVDDVVEAVAERAREENWGQAPVHCETLLLLHHHNSADSSGKVFNVFGVSKLSCYGCAVYFDAYNASEGRRMQFFTTGDHSNTYTPLAIPLLRNSDPQPNDHVEIIFNRMCEDYHEYVSSRTLPRRRGSDSTVTSEISNP